MQKLVKIFFWLGLLFILYFIVSCDDYFEYSPYAANVKNSFKNIDTQNFNKLYADTTYKDTIKFAVFADSHYNYNELSKAITNVNNRSDIDFVIVNGDMADHGYLKEYELFHEKMEKLTAPYFTVIGNHDYKSNGIEIYKQMYGHPNKSFVYQDNFFILWDDIFWESNRTPNMNWLEAQLRRASAGSYKNIFVLAHIPPFGEQFTEEDELQYKDLILSHPVDLSIHGHVHRFIFDDYYNDGMIYLTVESIMDKEYVIITASANEVGVEQVKF